MEDIRDIFIAKGEHMTDRDGNTICFAARDIMLFDDGFCSNDFEDWAGTSRAIPFERAGNGIPAVWVDGQRRVFDGILRDRLTFDPNREGQ
jgi:hypothetical protein